MCKYHGLYGRCIFNIKKKKIENKFLIDMLLNSGFVSPLVKNKINKLKTDYSVSFSYTNMLKDLKIFDQSNFNYSETLSRVYKIFKVLLL